MIIPVGPEFSRNVVNAVRNAGLTYGVIPHNESISGNYPKNKGLCYQSQIDQNVNGHFDDSRKCLLVIEDYDTIQRQKLMAIDFDLHKTPDSCSLRYALEHFELEQWIVERALFQYRPGIRSYHLVFKMSEELSAEFMHNENYKTTIEHKHNPDIPIGIEFKASRTFLNLGLKEGKQVFLKPYEVWPDLNVRLHDIIVDTAFSVASQQQQMITESAERAAKVRQHLEGKGIDNVDMDFRIERYRDVFYPECLNEIRGLAKGERNNEFYKRAFRVGCRYAALGLHKDIVINDLIEAGTASGLPRIEAVSVVSSAMKGSSSCQEAFPFSD